MKVLMCSVPVSPIEQLAQSQEEAWQPVGILRVLSFMEENGYSSDIYDIDNIRPSYDELIKNFKKAKPTVVGLSAVLSHCYSNVKSISKILRELFPDVWIIVGGNLSASANVILRKTEADVCVVGDGEIPFVKLLDYIKLHPTRRELDYKGLHQIKGIAFIDENNQIKVTGNADQVPGKELPYPNLERQREGMVKFSGNDDIFYKLFTPYERSDLSDSMIGDQIYPEEIEFQKKHKDKKIYRIHLSRGCVARCTFCQRATKGYRVYPLQHLESHIMELKNKYNVGHLKIYDENFGSNRQHSYEIARLIKKLDMNWAVQNARVTSFTYEDLKFYKEHNMTFTQFGIESGSQKILDIIEKKVSLNNLYDTIENCKKARVATNPENMLLGMPGETKETVIESSKFTASLRHLLGMDWNVHGNPMVIAIPGTPLYEYCQQIGVIGKTLDEEEDYLIKMASLDAKNILDYVNKTDYSAKEVHYWTYLFRYAAKKAHVNLIIGSNTSLKNKLLQLYTKCIKSTILNQIANYKARKKKYKNINILQKIKHLTLPALHFFLSLSILLAPKEFLFFFIKRYANLKFYFLEKKYKVKNGKQIHNLFTPQSNYKVDNLKLTESRISNTDRAIDKSLRSIVMENRKKMDPARTEEEKSLQILAQAQ